MNCIVMTARHQSNVGLGPARDEDIGGWAEA